MDTPLNLFDMESALLNNELVAEALSKEVMTLPNDFIWPRGAGRKEKEYPEEDKQVCYSSLFDVKCICRTF